MTAIGVAMASCLSDSSGPTVSARLDGRVNSSEVFTNVYSGAELQNDGDEWEIGTTSSLTNLTTWLDSGSASDVWVQMTLTSGSWNSSNAGTGTRLNLGTTRLWRVIRSSVGSQSAVGYWTFYDAATGGNTLQTTSSSTWTATRTFNPCPLCCFTPDTLITMANGMKMRIADVKEGDKILTTTEDMLDVYEKEVTEVIVMLDRPMFRIHFSNGAYLEASEDHPLHVKGKGAASINPTIEYKDLGIPKKLELGDEAFDEFGNLLQIVKIEPMHYPEAVYTFAESYFFANGILVY